MKLASIIDRYHSPFIQKYGHRLSTQQRTALHAMQHCHTSNFGENRWRCFDCGFQDASFRSCGHRSCPQCQHHDTSCWLARAEQKLLPVHYYMVTFTLPAELRGLAFYHQEQVFSALISCAVDTLRQFAENDKNLHGQLGMTGVLHTHSRRLDFHPHFHVIVPGGAIDKERKQWVKKRGKYLFRQQSLAKVFRARLLRMLSELGFRLPTGICDKWIVDCRRVGKGLQALQYLSRYLYRGVIQERNIIGDNGSQVTFQFIDSKTKTTKTRSLNGEDFLWLILQHVLPKGFRRVRDYGYLHGNAKQALHLVQLLLHVVLPPLVQPTRPVLRCPCCKSMMSLTQFIAPRKAPG